MAEYKNIRLAVSGIYDYAESELPTLRLPLPGQGAPDWVERKPLYKVYRPAPVLAAAADKFKMLPLTHHHPRVPVDGANFRDLAVGYTGENVWVDWLEDSGEVGIRSGLMLYDEEAVKAYDNGEIQLSPGYMADFEWRKGKAPNGEEYDIVMKEIRDVNHLALLPNGRGGSDAVVLDAAPAARTVFDYVRNRKEVLDYGSVFDLVECEVRDVKYEDGHVSHRKDGDYVKQGDKWLPLGKKTDNSDKEKSPKSLNTEDYKKEQLKVIQESNPMSDDYHVGIRKLEDIKTFEEAMKDDESFYWGDFSREDAENALKKGTVTIYSSKPIEKGVFVSTSLSQAKDYAGGGKVYSMELPLKEVAWINGDEGEYTGNVEKK